MPLRTGTLRQDADVHAVDDDAVISVAAEVGREVGLAQWPTSPQRPTSTALRSLGELALAAADRYSGDAMRAPGRPAITYADFGRAIREIAGGLASLGVATGDKVAILCGTVPEWTLADFGAFCAGATVVPVYHTNSPEECEYVLSHSGAKVILLEDAAQAAKIAKVRDELPELEHVVVLDAARPRARSRSPTCARAAPRRRRRRARAHRGRRRPTDAGDDRLHVGHHRPAQGLRALAREPALHAPGAYIDRLDMRAAPPVIFQYLPLAHVLARMVSFVALDTGGTLAFWGGDTKNLAEDIAEAEPTHIPTVPRLLEKIHTRVVGSAAAAGGAKARDLHARAGDRREGRQGQARGPQGQPDRQAPATRPATSSRCRRCATRSAPTTRS